VGREVAVVAGVVEQRPHAGREPVGIDGVDRRQRLAVGEAVPERGDVVLEGRRQRVAAGGAPDREREVVAHAPADGLAEQAVELRPIERERAVDRVAVDEAPVAPPVGVRQAEVGDDVDPEGVVVASAVAGVVDPPDRVREVELPEKRPEVGPRRRDAAQAVVVGREVRTQAVGGGCGLRLGVLLDRRGDVDQRDEDASDRVGEELVPVAPAIRRLRGDRPRHERALDPLAGALDGRRTVRRQSRGGDLRLLDRRPRRLEEGVPGVERVELHRRPVVRRGE
jgi:hypothetical protein